MLVDIWTLSILTILESILSIDNLIFVSIAIDKIPNSLKGRVRFIGFCSALLMRFLTLFFVSHILSIHKPIFYPESIDISIKDLLLVSGGLFLITKSFIELWSQIFHRNERLKINVKSQLFLTIVQIMLIDLVFSFDSILAALILTKSTIIIAIAFTFSALATLFTSSYASQLIKSNSNLKVITILFVLLVGIYLTLEGLHIELPKVYLYSSFVFAFFIEAIRKKLKITRSRNYSKTI